MASLLIPLVLLHSRALNPAEAQANEPSVPAPAAPAPSVPAPVPAPEGASAASAIEPAPAPRPGELGPSAAPAVEDGDRPVANTDANTEASSSAAPAESPVPGAAAAETAAGPVASADSASPALPAPPLESALGGFQMARWKDLPGWGDDPLGPSLEAFLQSCAAIGSAPEWRQACTAAAHLPPDHDRRRLQQFFETYFTPWQVSNTDGSKTGMITGYYEPLLHGSRTRSERYRYPLFSAPEDLLTVELASSYPEFKNKGLRGRLQNGRVVPYFSRQEIEAPNSPFKGRELVWVDDAVDAFFLHIQGSGQVQLDTGDTMRVGFADQNGHPFRSVARYLWAMGEMRPEQTSMAGIKNWARAHPDKVQSFLNFNPRYVFFRELPLNLPGPLGTLGVPLTAERSVAVDPRFIPLGAPVYLSTTRPSTGKALNRLVLAQDTGGVITGGVRADFFWGFGDSAGKLAGSMRQRGRLWLLLPKGYQ